MAKDLTIKQRKWIDAYIETGNATEAAMLVYDCKDRDSAAIIGHENVRKLNFADLLEKKGITDNRLASKIDEGLEAKKIVTSHTEPDREVDDRAVQHKYLETALKLKGHSDKQQANIQVNILNAIKAQREEDYEEQ